MINSKTLAWLAAVTFVLFIVGGLMPKGDTLYVVDDIVWFGLLGCALATVVMSVAVLVRWAASRRRTS